MWFALFITAFFGLFQYRIYKQMHALPVVFNLWWVCIIIMFIATRDNYYDITTAVWTYIIIGNIAINIASLFYKGAIGEKSFSFGSFLKQTDVEDVIWVNVGNKIYIVQFIFFIVMIPLLIKALPTVLSGGFGTIRQVYVGVGGEAFMTTIERIIYIHFIVFPGVTACNLIQANLWSKGLMPLRKMWIAILNVGVITIITGARTWLFSLVIYMLAAYLINSSFVKKLSTKEYKRIRRNILLIILVSFFAFVFITSQRSMGYGRTTRENFIDTISVYFTGGIKLFDLTLSSPTSFGLMDRMHGLSFIGGLLSVFQLILMYIPGIGSFFYGDLISNQVQQFVTGYYAIGKSVSMNAFPTMYYYFMRDFGVLGILFGGCVFGWLITWATTRSRRNNIHFSLIYCICMYLVIFSVCWWDPYRMEFWTIIIQVLFWEYYARRKSQVRGY